ncbi:hypothetical protein F5Y08DRAFT_313412 [Xylaria arbuscula]|nr:hypothetical protein F5Y08DRAFT_313412 [Xylaria arbuscula]
MLVMLSGWLATWGLAPMTAVKLKSVHCPPQFAVEKEIRRRVMFSCFIMDKMVTYRWSI